MDGRLLNLPYLNRPMPGLDLNREPDPELDEPPLIRNLWDIMDVGVQVTGTRPCKKSRIRSEVEDGDHFSNLPTDIMSCILSRLPTNEAVRTSILSKYWRLKWTCVHSVHMNYLNRWNEEDKATFINFMHRLLLINPHNITSFSWKPMIDSPSLLTIWISAVLRKKVENFEMKLLVINSEKEESDIFLPFMLLTISGNSLRKLKLELDCTFTNVNPKNCFPNLTSLFLCGVHLHNGNTNNLDEDTVSLTFPVLEKWETVYCRWLNVKIVEIYPPSLTMFSSKTGTKGFYGGRSYLVRLIAPRLGNFISTGSGPENIVMGGGGLQVVSAVLSNEVYNADVDVLANIGQQVGQLLNEFSSLEELDISKFLVVALRAGGLTFGLHDKLRRLMFTCFNDSLELVFELLHAAPTLKYLSIHVACLKNYNYNSMEYIPSCIISHLEEIQMSAFTSTKRQNKLAKFLLENGGQLKKFSFSVGHSYALRKKFAKELSKFNRRQTSLTLTFECPDETIVIP